MITNVFPIWSFLQNLCVDQKAKWFCKLFWNTKLLTFKDGSSITTKEFWESREHYLKHSKR